MSWLIVYIVLSVNLINPPTLIHATVLTDKVYASEQECKDAAIAKFAQYITPLSAGQRFSYACFPVQ